MYELHGKRIWVAGHNGMVGSAIVRRLMREDVEILTSPRSEVDLQDCGQVKGWMSRSRPDCIIIAAAKVGGILANSRFPVDFLQNNLEIQTSIMKAAFEFGVERLLFLGSSCIYPKYAEQPIIEESLLTGALESTNNAYAIAKIAGIKLCQAYREQHGCDWIAAMPTNLYGPGDNYDLEGSHVLPALVRKFHEAKVRGDQEVTVWGSGTPKREFLHCDDLADALVFLVERYSDHLHINVGSSEEISISDLTSIIAEVVGYKASVNFDFEMPDGVPRRLMDSSRLQALGWNNTRPLSLGIRETYQDWIQSSSSRRE